MSIILDGTTGITTPGLTNTGTETILNLTTTGNTILGDATTDTLNVGAGGLVKDASGNVGIGTASPGQKFHVAGAGANDSALYFNTVIQNNSTAATSAPKTGIDFSAYYSGTSNFANFAGITGGKENTTDNNSAGVLYFCTAPNAGSPTERMRIDSSGNVGIGTSSPATKLDVYGTKTLASDLGVTNIRDTASYATGNGGAIVLMGKYNSGGSYVGGAYVNAYKENATDGNYSYALTFGTNVNGGSMSERMRIDSSGQLGLGCTPSVVGSAAGYRAFYLGTASGSGLLGNGSDTYLLCNAYYDAAWKAVASANVSAYQLSGTTHYWRSAANPGAGGTLTWTNVMTLDKDQTLSLQGASTGVSGTGITFPATQSASSDANTLDDYEEGTWTPVATAISGSITSYSSSGTYTKVGRTVVAWFKVLLTNVGTASGRMNLSSFPFTSIATGGPTASYFVVREDDVTGNTFYGALNGGASTAVISNSTYGAITWTNNYSYIGLVVYQASS